MALTKLNNRSVSAVTSFLSEVTNSDLPAGTVLQVQQAVKTDTWSKSGWGMADITGLSVNITPISANSKIVVTWRVIASSGYYSTYVDVVRDSTKLFYGQQPSARAIPTSLIATDQTLSNTHGFVHHHVGSYVDSPSTTNQLTYKLQGSGRRTSDVMYVNRSVPDRDATEYDFRGASNIIVYEIAG